MLLSCSDCQEPPRGVSIVMLLWMGEISHFHLGVRSGYGGRTCEDAIRLVRFVIGGRRDC